MTSIFQAGQPFNIVRTSSATYQASGNDLVISSGDEVALPSPDQGATVLVRPAPSIDSVTITTSNGTIGNTGETFGIYRATEPIYLVGDGTDWYARSGAEEISAIPDSVVAYLDAQESFTSSDDGTQVTTWPNLETGQPDPSGTGAIVRESGINGSRSLEFDGADDEFNISSTNYNTLTQPNTIIAVVESLNVGATEVVTSHESGTDGKNNIFNDSNGFYQASAGSSLNSNTSTNPAVVSVVYNGANSVIRVNGAEATGDAGTQNMESWQIGAEAFASYFRGYIGAIEVADADLQATGELSDEETKLAEKWGITI